MWRRDDIRKHSESASRILAREGFQRGTDVCRPLIKKRDIDAHKELAQTAQNRM